MNDDHVIEINDEMEYKLWVQSFTSSKADLRQDINGGFVFIRGLNETFLEGSAPLRLRSEDLYMLLFSFGLMYQCLKGAIPLSKCSIKAPSK